MPFKARFFPLRAHAAKFVLFCGFLTLVSSLFAQSAGQDVWALYYSSDLKTYAANLRRAGAPESVVSLLISQDVNNRFEAREAQLRPSTASATALRDAFSPERREAWMQLRLEKNTLLREVLGTVPKERALTEWSPKVLARLSQKDRDYVRMVTEDYDTMMARVISEAHGHFLDDDRTKLRYLETQRSVDLGKVLSADEITDFELLQTGFGRVVRSRLRLLGPTQEQLRTVYTLGKKHGMDLVMIDNNSSRRSDALQALNSELATVWDADTYARYRRSTSVNFQQLYNLVARLKLDPEIANKIYDSQKKTTEEGRALFNESHPGAEDIPHRPTAGRLTTVVPAAEFTDATKANRAKIVALVTQHCEFVQQQLGADGYTQYLELCRGWIDLMKTGGSTRLDYSM
jgi:hypothetical protein